MKNTIIVGEVDFLTILRRTGEAGLRSKQRNGAGEHGGDKHTHRRRNRRSNRQEERRARCGGGDED